MLLHWLILKMYDTLFKDPRGTWCNTTPKSTVTRQCCILPWPGFPFLLPFFEFPQMTEHSADWKAKRTSKIIHKKKVELYFGEDLYNNHIEGEKQFSKLIHAHLPKQLGHM